MLACHLGSPGSIPGQSFARFLEYIVALGQVLSLSALVFPWQYHSVKVPY